RWGRISTASSWGWFDPRLHPFAPGAQPTTPPRRENGRTVLGNWMIAMHFGDQQVTASGVLERRLVVGGFLATLDPPPDGLEVNIGQGPIPALLLRAPAGVPVMVQGADGLPFLRLDASGVYANPRSRSFQETSAFAGARRQADGWARVGEAGSVSWTEPRLAYEADRPPDVVVKAERTAELGRWRIPVTVDGKDGDLTGTIIWVPAKNAAGLGRGSGGGGLPPWVWPVGVLGVVIAAGVGARARTRARAAASAE
ncbi:MAG TPA: hypothetical protein VMZ00_15630, partial [Sporichthya sp.]|nr:hypothetical protein [Sporichthya sp.]